MKRPLSLAATIVGTVISSIQMVMYIFTSVAMLVMAAETGDPYNGGTGVDFMMVIALLASVLFALVFIITFALNCVSYTYVNADHEKYVRRRGITITLTVLNFIICALLLIGCAAAVPSTIVFSLIAIAMLITSNVFYYIDLGKEKRRCAKAE